MTTQDDLFVMYDEPQPAEGNEGEFAGEASAEHDNSWETVEEYSEDEVTWDADDGYEDEEPDDDPSAKYPHVHVKLSGEDGNAFSIIGRVDRALKTAGVSSDARKEYREEATAGDYDNLLATTAGWVTVY